MDEMINEVEIQPEQIGMGDQKWYEKAMSLKDIRTIINANYQNIKRSFIAIGFYLKKSNREKSYLEDGYKSIWEFAYKEYGLSMSSASRYMNINSKFSIDGDSPYLQEKYKDFSKSQLQEMLALNEEQLEQVTPKMAVLDIRDMARPEELEEEQVPGQIDITEFPEYLPPDMSVGNMEVYGETSGEAERKTSFTMSLADMLGGEPVEEEGEPPIAISQQAVESCRPMEEEILPDESWSIGELPQAKEKYVRNLARVFVEKMGSQLVLESFSSIPSDEAIERKIKELDREEGGAVEIEEGILASAGAEIIEFFRGGEDLGVCSFARLGTQVRKALEERQKRETNVSDSEGREGEEKLEEVIDAEYTEIHEPEKEGLTDLGLAREKLERAKSLLDKCLNDMPDEDNIYIRGMKLTVAAWESLVCDMDAIENHPPKLEQPELPLLKNNDQRAAFVDNYETWPLWIETEETGERYYRYDLEDGTSMVVKVYHAMLFDYKVTGLKYEERFTEGYGRHEYYLLEPGKFFRDCGVNRPALIEKLKEIQRRN